MSGFLTNLARRGAGIAPTIVPRMAFGSEAAASGQQATNEANV